MRVTHSPFPEHSFLGACVKLAQTTFFDNLPANAEQKPPTAPVVMPAAKIDAVSPLAPSRWMTRLDNWFHVQAMKDREAYLAQSKDVFELESRIRQLERRAYF